MPRWEWVEGWFNLSSGSLRSVSGSEKKRWAFNIVAILIFYAIVWINPIFYFLFFVHSNLLLETIIPPVEKKWWWKLVAKDMFHWYRHHGPSKQSLCMRTVFGHHSLSPILPFQGPKGMYLYHLCSKFKVQTSNHNTGLKFAYHGFLTSTLILACDEVCLHFTCWIWDNACELHGWIKLLSVFLLVLGLGWLHNSEMTPKSLNELWCTDVVSKPVFHLFGASIMCKKKKWKCWEDGNVFQCV
jgi:hypothetical protein